VPAGPGLGNQTAPPNTVTYIDPTGLTVMNTVLLNQALVFEAPGFDVHGGPLSIQVDTMPLYGSLQFAHNYDFIYTPSSGYSGTDSFQYEVVQNGVSLVGMQEIDFVVGTAGCTGGNGNSISDGGSTGSSRSSAAPAVTYSPVAVDGHDSTTPMFTTDGVTLPLIDPVLDLNAFLHSSTDRSPLPAGLVVFTYTDSSGSTFEVGSTFSDNNGNAAAPVDGLLLVQPSVTIGIQCSAYAGALPNDGGAIGQAVAGNPVVPHNPWLGPVPPANQGAINGTVVVVCGADGAQSLQWMQSARQFYGPGAYIFTDVHSIPRLGTSMAIFGPGTVTRLVIGAHGNQGNIQLGAPQSRGTYLNAGTLSLRQNQTALASIQQSMAAGAVFDIQSCNFANGQQGFTAAQLLGITLGRSVYAPCDYIIAWEDEDSSWVTIPPP
jgi:hypothetical protein